MAKPDSFWLIESVNVIVLRLMELLFNFVSELLVWAGSPIKHSNQTSLRVQKPRRASFWTLKACSKLLGYGNSSLCISFLLYGQCRLFPSWIRVSWRSWIDSFIVLFSVIRHKKTDEKSCWKHVVLTNIRRTVPWLEVPELHLQFMVLEKNSRQVGVDSSQ